MSSIELANVTYHKWLVPSRIYSQTMNVQTTANRQIQ